MEGLKISQEVGNCTRGQFWILDSVQNSKSATSVQNPKSATSVQHLKLATCV